MPGRICFSQYNTARKKLLGELFLKTLYVLLNFYRNSEMLLKTRFRCCPLTPVYFEISVIEPFARLLKIYSLDFSITTLNRKQLFPVKSIQQSWI